MGSRSKSSVWKESLPQHLPVVDRVFDVPEDKRVCPTHGAMTCMGCDETETLVQEPAKLYRFKNKFMKYACPCCSENGIVSSERPTGLVDGNKYDTSIAATIVTDKYDRHLPVNRQVDSFASSVSRSAATKRNASNTTEPSDCSPRKKSGTRPPSRFATKFLLVDVGAYASDAIALLRDDFPKWPRLVRIRYDDVAIFVNFLQKAIVFFVPNIIGRAHITYPFRLDGILHCKPWSHEHRSIVEQACSGSRNSKHTSFDFPWAQRLSVYCRWHQRYNL